MLSVEVARNFVFVGSIEREEMPLFDLFDFYDSKALKSTNKFFFKKNHEVELKDEKANKKLMGFEKSYSLNPNKVLD